MKQVNIHEAKTHLSALIEEVVSGEPLIIAKSGKPQVIVYSYHSSLTTGKRTGFMPELQIPADFDSYMRKEIEDLFYGENNAAST